MRAVADNFAMAVLHALPVDRVWMVTHNDTQEHDLCGSTVHDMRAVDDSDSHGASLGMHE